MKLTKADITMDLKKGQRRKARKKREKYLRQLKELK